MGGDAIPSGTAPALKLDELDRALRDATTEEQSQAAHRAAGWYAWELVARSGQGQVLQWLRNGLPANAVAGIR
jgi:hypothetical protein